MIQAAPTNRLTVIVSKGQSRAPQKRQLEQAIADAAATRAGVDVIIVPHLYDLPPQGETVQRLRELDGDLVVLAWVFPRAAHWVLDRYGIRGQVGEVELCEEIDEDETAADADENPLEPAVVDAEPRPDRRIYTLDLRLSESADAFIEEIDRIFAGDSPGTPATDTSAPSLFQLEEVTTRRWYPVIDFSRCTNCMECIDFCLFGVYGVDDAETILVEQPDNCRKGCPACSRVCPANAIIFPQHKAPGIAGSAAVDGGGLKIDLSLLFGAQDKDEDPIEVAARERDEQLLLAGRQAVGIDEKLAKRQADQQEGPKDDLDHLLDELDSLDL